MDIIITILNTTGLFLLWVAMVGLIVGSFLNVLIYRLPIMMDRESFLFCHDYLKQETTIPQKYQDRYDLLLPSSNCPVCHAPIKAWQNIPVISYLLLKGHCRACKTSISPRYPLIELLTCLSSLFLAWHFGPTWTTLAVLFFNWTLIALFFIDIDHQLLPDCLTLFLLWIGLLASLCNLFVDSQAAILGAVAGYTVFWIVANTFKWITKKDGMGYGDIKLLAALGAWLGWQSLPLVVFISAFLGLMSTLLYCAITRKPIKGVPFPFGPYLITAGWVGLLWGDSITQWYFSTMGMV